MTAAGRAALALMALGWAGSARARADGCRETTIHRAKPMMATLVTVSARGCGGGELEEAVRESFAEAARLAAMLSEWEPESAVSRVNARAGRAPVRVPPELVDVLGTALRVSELTSGAFDVTWAPLAAAWRFESASPRVPSRVPSREEVARLRALVGHRGLVLDPAARTAFLARAGMRIGLGGIAKGYVAEAMAELLVRRGVRDVLVAASGDIAARGRNGARPWTVAVRDPRAPSRARAVVELHDESISTSGDYERFFGVGGRRYHHLLDPATGYPARGTASVTVIAPHGALADALATGLFVLGRERGAAVARGLPGVSALFVAEDGSERVAQGGPRFGPPEERAIRSGRAGTQPARPSRPDPATPSKSAPSSPARRLRARM